KVQYYTNE
ncbi:unnamed protein product, partial [Allacma fusca]